ncbi:MAG: restriction endonuclease [Candidatus Nanoarchaeia archaeon]|nr:restriction endonuclease [Candidatus Nanoarchaeia archaeon]
MANIFSEIEGEIFLDDCIPLDEGKIREFILKFLTEKINSKAEKEQPFFFEDIVFDFFSYRNIKATRSKKTRDMGIDGIITLNLDVLGNVNLGLQIKHKIINSNDIDLFLASLKNAELQLGVIVCKDSRKLEKYELNSKLRAILLSKGIIVKERLIKEKVDINPIVVLKMSDLIELVASEMRAVAKGIYKQ